ncbi:uncharacterized protein ARMOST_11222 [Armillaria ostoyae]|uniref:Uncharacterized protein n=1 Tax=Armillaria ostoyae TaxID=47428 RepID=A0A284RGJ6_ARMOS|nr:uncharacterized protein ARMOST_11222 [Armillaria ostoyae]
MQSCFSHGLCKIVDTITLSPIFITYAPARLDPTYACLFVVLAIASAPCQKAKHTREKAEAPPSSPPGPSALWNGSSR